MYCSCVDILGRIEVVVGIVFVFVDAGVVVLMLMSSKLCYSDAGVAVVYE